MWGGTSLAHVEFKARKSSYKVLQGWGDGQVRELSAIYCFPLLFVSDVSSEQLRPLKSLKHGHGISLTVRADPNSSGLILPF